MQFSDRDAAGFVADQLGEALRAMEAGNNGLAASILVAMDEEARDTGALVELLSKAAERLVGRLRAGTSRRRPTW